MGYEPSSPNLDEGQTPYERSSRAEISEEEYRRLEREHHDRLDALKDAFEKSVVEAAEHYMRERERQVFAFYGEDLTDSPWDLGTSLAQVVK